ncbi:MAG TPA: DUF3971 domain-containing protein [Gammaproteobacteria bacterium]
MPRKPRKKKPLNARRVKNWVLSFLGLTIIFFAITFTVARIAIKTVPDYIADLQTALSKQSGFDVRIGVLDAEINWLVPRLNLINVNVFDPQGTRHVLHLDTIDFSLDWFASLRTRSLVVGEISLSGLNGELTVNRQSQLLFQDYVISENINRVQDAAGSGDNAIFKLSERMQYLLNNLNFRIIDSQLRFTDQRRSQKPRVFSHFNLHLMNQGDQHLVELKAELPQTYGRYLRLVAEAEGDLFDYKNLQGKLQLSLENIVAATWLDEYWGELGVAANADLNADIWLAWQGTQLNDLYSRFSLQDAALHYLDSEVRSWQMESLAGELWWQNTADGWTLDVRDLQAIRGSEVWPKSSAFNLQYKDSQRTVNLSADFMRVESMIYLADMLNSAAIVENSWFNLLADYQPSGDVKYLQLMMQLDNADSLQFNADFDRVSFKLPEFEPSAVDNLRGTIEYRDNNAKLKLHSSESRLHFKRLFRDSMEITRLTGELDLQRQPNGWQVSSEHLRMHTPHIESQSRFIISLPENAPAFMDLTTRYQNGNAEYIGRYLPASIMGRNTLAWLDRSILSGRIRQGGYQFYGNLRDMPFRASQGVSLAVFDVEQVKLDYQNNWPQIDEIDAQLRFENESMQIDAERGKLFNSQIKQTRVEINSFRKPLLNIDGTIDTNLADIGQFFNDSPLDKSIPGYFDNVLLQGKGQLALQLDIPLSGKQTVNWRGVLKPEQARLTLQRENYQFEGLTGELQFADGLFEADDLRARLGEHELAITVKPADTEIQQHHIAVDGVVDIKQFLSPLPMVHEYLNGASHWQVVIDLSPAPISGQPVLALHASSQLESVLSSLPGPLAKTSADALPAELQLRVMPDQKMQLELQLADNRLLSLKELHDYWALDIAAPSIKGNAIISKQASLARPLDINLQQLNLRQFIDASSAQDSLEPAAKKQVSESHESHGLDAIKPGDIPSVNLTIAQLIWDEYVFRDVRLSTTQTQNAMMIKTLKLSTDDYDLSSEGSWQSSWSQQHSTHLKTQIQLHNLGRALKRLDITSDIEDTRGLVDLDLRWNDKPYAFSWGKLNGSGRLALKEGVLSKINAGPARMLGLFNLKTVLSLDFASQLSEGFAFDQADGSFSISRGNIYSDNLSIESKVADILLRGRLDMQKKTVEQTIRVRPHVGSSVAFGTTVVAGPAAGGLVYLLQKMFTPDKLSEYEYRVSGSLKKPQVTLLSVPDNQAQQSAPGATTADEF